MQQALAYHRLRAPAEHGQALVDPPADHIREMLRQNLERRHPDARILDRSFSEFVRESRETMQRRQGVALDQPIIMSGHQPELFHPGVWFKNFALASMSQSLGAGAVHVTIDNDLCRTTFLRAPLQEDGELRVEAVAYDDNSLQIPFEDRPVQNRELFSSFGKRLEARLDGLVPEPLIRTFWPLVQSRLEQDDRISALFSGARSDLERQFGLHNEEAFLSRLCDTSAFRRFILHLTADAARFAQVHNHALQDYRRVNRVRSKSHPAPPLIARHHWIETPFWIWTADNPIRQPMFASNHGDRLRLGFPGGIELNTPQPEGNPTEAITQLAEAVAEQSVRIRPRALATTMYLRLFLSDLFLHGVGGAKYDQLTDELIRRFWKINAPNYVVLTATARLPLATAGNITKEAVRELDYASRKMWFHPDAFMQNVDAKTEDLISEKRKRVAESPAKGSGQPRRMRINQINAALRPAVEDQRQALLKRRSEMVHALRLKRALESREFSFCVHSLQTLPRLLLALCPKPS